MSIPIKPNFTMTGLVAITHIPAGEEFTVRQLRERLATMGLTTEGSDSPVVRLIQQAEKRGLLIRSKKTASQLRADRPSTRQVPVYIRTDVTHIHAPPGRVEEAEKALPPQ